MQASETDVDFCTVQFVWFCRITPWEDWGNSPFQSAAGIWQVNDGPPGKETKKKKKKKKRKEKRKKARKKRKTHCFFLVVMNSYDYRMGKIDLYIYIYIYIYIEREREREWKTKREMINEREIENDSKCKEENLKTILGNRDRKKTKEKNYKPRKK